jgi:hypothetical protein
LRDSEPIIDKIQFDKVNEFIQHGVDEGANLEIGGSMKGDSSGFFVPTAIFTNVTDEMSIAKVRLIERLTDRKKSLARFYVASSLVQKRKSSDVQMILHTAWLQEFIPETSRLRIEWLMLWRPGLFG